MELRFVTKDEMRRAVATRSVELVLTSPFSYRRLGLTDARVIAGLVQTRTPDPNRAGAAVVVVDADREDLTGFSSLAGKRVGLSPHYGLNVEGIFRAAWLDEGNVPETLKVLAAPQKDAEALAELAPRRLRRARSSRLPPRASRRAAVSFDGKSAGRLAQEFDGPRLRALDGALSRIGSRRDADAHARVLAAHHRYAPLRSAHGKGLLLGRGDRLRGGRPGAHDAGT